MYLLISELVLDMVMKPTSAYEHIKVSHIINIIFLVHIFATLVAICSDVHCEGKIMWTVTCRKNIVFII
jgi:hypothetical protein